MAITVTWQSAERDLLSLLDLIEAEDAAAAEAVFVGTSPISTGSINDEAFYPAKLRSALVDAYVQIARMLCLTESHPRRVLFRKTINVNDGDPLPSCIGPYGLFKSGTRLMRELSLDDIDAIKADPGSALGVEQPYFAKDGNTLVSLLTPVTVEYYDVDRPVDHPSKLATLFDEATDKIGLPDEMVLALVQMAAGIVASTAAGLVGDAGGYFAVSEKLLRDFGVDIEKTDFFEHRRAG